MLLKVWIYFAVVVCKSEDDDVGVSIMIEVACLEHYENAVF